MVTTLAVLFIPLVSVSAHLSGPPFLLVNNQLTEDYPIRFSSAPSFILPYEKAVKRYLVNESITFSVDTTALAQSMTLSDADQFLWDFGDGITAEGREVTHRYQQGKTYIVSLTLSDGIGAPVPVELVLLHIVPSTDYQLPQPRIMINEQPITNSDTPLIQDMAQEFRFSAERSVQGTAPIASYTWDVGDGQTMAGGTVQYTYSKSLAGSAYPVLRATDQNGYFMDSSAWIQDPASALKSESQRLAELRRRFIQRQLLPLLGVLAGLGLVYGLIRYHYLRKRKGK